MRITHKRFSTRKIIAIHLGIIWIMPTTTVMEKKEKKIQILKRLKIRIRGIIILTTQNHCQWKVKYQIWVNYLRHLRRLLLDHRQMRGWSSGERGSSFQKKPNIEDTHTDWFEPIMGRWKILNSDITKTWIIFLWR